MRRVSRENTDMIESRKIDANKLVDANSLVSKYEILIKESAPEEMSEERSILLFKVFDNLLPHLGIFKPLLSVIRDELFEYVFSSEHHTARATSDNASLASSKTDSIHRVPYHSLIKQIFATRDVKSEDLEAKVELLKETLFKKQVQFEESMEAIAGRNEDNSSLYERIDELEKIVEAKDKAIKQLHDDIDAGNELLEKTERNLWKEMDILQSDCAEKDAEIAYLSTFKKGYDDLNDAFQDSSYSGSSKLDVDAHKTAVFATKKEHVISDIQSSRKLEEQILTVMNTMIEQYDLYLEEQKVELGEKQVANQEDIVLLRTYEREIYQADQELWSIQERFKLTMEDVNCELALVRQHITMLDEKLTGLEEEENKISEEKNRAKANKKKPKIPQKANDAKVTLDEIKNMSLDASDYLEEEYEGDPYVPHERIFSKYSIMLLYSQDAGKTYYIHQDSKYCESCDEKTIACPHKVLGENKIILMPHRITHIKLQRPAVKITRDIIEPGEKPTTADTGLGLKGMSAKSKKSAATVKSERISEIISERASTSGSRATSAPSPSKSGTVVQLVHPLTKVWEDYHSKTDIPRPIYRSLSLKRTYSLLEQFYAYIAWQDEFASEEDGYGSVLDNLYDFFSARYIVKEAKFAAVHDFLSAVIHHSAENKDLQIFAHSLVGNIDFATCRYILCLSDFIETIDWQDVEDFRSFAIQIYPFIQDEDLESLQMGYVSYSENKISKLHVFDYILYMILKGREPRIQELEHQLMQYPGREIGLMADEEFMEATEAVLQLSNEKTRKTLFAETLLLQQMESDSVVVHASKLACILAYLQFLEQTMKVKDIIHEFIVENRPKHEESLGVHGHVVKLDSSIHLLNMADIKNLSYNVSRRDKCRKERIAIEDELATD